jgi:hypothetical protein
MHSFLTIVIGIVMLYGLFTVISQERAKENKKPLGCIASIVIIILVLLFWALLDKL